MWRSSAAMNMHRLSLIVCSLISVTLLAACSGINRSDKPATRTWWLEPYSADAAEQVSDPALILDLALTVVPGLDTQRILTLSDTAELNRYSGARWADSLPELVGSLIGRSLESSNRFKVASSAGDLNDCELELELRQFYAILNPSRETTDVQVAMSGRYQCDDAEPVFVEVSARMPVGSDRMELIVAGFQQALNETMRSLLEQI